MFSAEVEEAGGSAGPRATDHRPSVEACVSPGQVADIETAACIELDAFPSCRFTDPTTEHSHL